MNSKLPSVVRAEDPDAVQHLQTKIATAEKLQATMKDANVIVRSRQLTDDEKVARLVAECGQREHRARELLKPDFAGRVGFPDFALTSNGANIRRMQARLKGLANESGRASVTLPFAGGWVEDNAEECRVRIYHDVKPPEGTIAKLRTYGFHWTPSLGCWQRLRNDSARFAATQITGVTWPPVPEVGAVGPSVALASSVAVAPGQGRGIAA
jgi:hypothetical protein